MRQLLCPPMLYGHRGTVRGAEKRRKGVVSKKTLLQRRGISCFQYQSWVLMPGIRTMKTEPLTFANWLR